MRRPNNYYHENATLIYLCIVTLHVAVNNINVANITTENETISPICIVPQQLFYGDFTLLSTIQTNYVFMPYTSVQF